MTEVNYNGKEELLMADYEGITDSDLTSKYANTDFDIIDAPSTYITNTQMTYALTCKRLFPAGDTYICNDEGTYKKGHIYAIKVDGETKSWEDVTPSDDKTIVDYATLESDTNLQKTIFENPNNYVIKTTIHLSTGGDVDVLCFPATSPEKRTDGSIIRFFASYPVSVYGTYIDSVAIGLIKNDGSEEIILVNVPLAYQQKLTAGEGITIDGSTIKANLSGTVKDGDDINYHSTTIKRDANDLDFRSETRYEDSEYKSVRKSWGFFGTGQLVLGANRNNEWEAEISIPDGFLRINQIGYDPDSGKETSYASIRGSVGSLHYVKSGNEIPTADNEIATKGDITSGGGGSGIVSSTSDTVQRVTIGSDSTTKTTISAGGADGSAVCSVQFKVGEVEDGITLSNKYAVGSFTSDTGSSHIFLGYGGQSSLTQQSSDGSKTSSIGITSDLAGLISSNVGALSTNGKLYYIKSEDEQDTPTDNYEVIRKDSLKTIFGNQSLAGSGNIDLYRHNLNILGTGGTAPTTIRIVLNLLSSSNTSIDSMTDFNNVLLSKFPVGAQVESIDLLNQCSGTVTTESGTEIIIGFYYTTNNGLVNALYAVTPSNKYNFYTFSGTKTFHDDVTTV